MSGIEIRPECPVGNFNRGEGTSCTEGDLCPTCWMDRDVEENKEMYQAMGDVEL